MRTSQVSAKLSQSIKFLPVREFVSISRFVLLICFALVVLGTQQEIVGMNEYTTAVFVGPDGQLIGTYRKRRPVRNTAAGTREKRREREQRIEEGQTDRGKEPDKERTRKETE